MKITILTLALLLPMKLVVASDDKYIATMKDNIAKLDEAKTVEDYQSIANTFERIASVETKKWEPLYYAAFSYIMMGNLEKEPARKDGYLDRSFKLVSDAKTIAPDESELFALEGFVYMMRVTVDPASRGAQYGGMSVGAYQKALALNPENPRAMILLAQMQFGTAKFFGSSTDEACQTGRLASAKFDSYQPSNPLAPKWGKKMSEGLIRNCQ